MAFKGSRNVYYDVIKANMTYCGYIIITFFFRYLKTRVQQQVQNAAKQQKKKNIHTVKAEEQHSLTF